MNPTKVSGVKQIRGPVITNRCNEEYSQITLSANYTLTYDCGLSQIFTCTSTKKNIKLPNCTELTVGWVAIIKNGDNSNVTISISDFGGNLITNDIPIGEKYVYICVNNSTQNGLWEVYSYNLKVNSNSGQINKNEISFGRNDFNFMGGGFLSYYDLQQTLGNTGVQTLNIKQYKVHYIAPLGDITLNLSENPPLNAVTVNTIIIVNGGSYNIIWPTGSIWIGTDGVAPSLQVTGTDIISMMTTSANKYLFHSGAN